MGDGLSFAEFESSSMDSLYNRGFANKKNLDEAAKNFKPEDFARQLQNGQPAVATSQPVQITAGSTQPAQPAPSTAGSTQHAQPAPITAGSTQPAQPAPITAGSTQPAQPSSGTPANAAPSGQRTWTPANLPNQTTRQ